MSQIISILASNPHLEHLTLLHISLSETDESGVQVPLRRLRTICLVGATRPIFRLLQQLELQEVLDSTITSTHDSTIEDIYQTFVPPMRDFFRGCTRFKDRLKARESFLDDIHVSVNTDYSLEATPYCQELWPVRKLFSNQLRPTSCPGDGKTVPRGHGAHSSGACGILDVGM